MVRGITKGFCLIVLASAALLRASSEPNPGAEDLYRKTEYKASLAALDRNSNDAATANLIGRNYFMLGEFKKSVPFFEKATKAEPNNGTYAHWLGRGYGRCAETANPFSAPGLAVKARNSFERAVQLEPKNREALGDLFEYYLAAPGFLGGGESKAADIASRIEAVDPAEGYFTRARLAEKRKEYDTAEQQLRRAIERAPRQVNRIIDLAKFLGERGRAQESDAVYAQAEKIAPSTPKLWFAKAGSFIKQKRNLPEAKQLLEKYLNASITPEDPPKEQAQELLKKASGA